MSLDKFAFDRASVRRIDEDGRLHVGDSNISKANICPYRGEEIPDYERLGLEPGRIYQLLRHPDELAKGASTFNNLPLLSKHVPVSAEDHQPDLVVGSTGTSAKFIAPFLRNSLVVWARDAIDGINSGAQRELSSAYRYDADMTPGEYMGARYDGVMRNIRGNHVALVPTGRAGADVVVGDAALPPNQEIPPMANRKTGPMSRRALVTSTAVGVALRPLLAQDQKMPDLKPLLAKVKDAKSWKAQRPAFMAALTKALTGKLAQDATLEDVTGMLDKLDDVVDEMEPDMLDPAPVDPAPVDPGPVDDADPMAKVWEFLADKLSPEDMAALKAIVEPDDAAPAEDAKEDDDDDKDGKGKKAPPFAKDTKNLVTKQAMDAEIKRAAKMAKDEAMAQMEACRAAEIEVRPVIGDLPGKRPTNPAEIFKLALDHMAVDLTDVPESAYGAVFRALPKGEAARPSKPAQLAKDAAVAAGSFDKMFPGARRISVAN